MIPQFLIVHITQIQLAPLKFRQHLLLSANSIKVGEMLMVFSQLYYFFSGLFARV